jgi:hypothetical protein
MGTMGNLADFSASATNAEWSLASEDEIVTLRHCKKSLRNSFDHLARSVSTEYGWGGDTHGSKIWAGECFVDVIVSMRT